MKPLRAFPFPLNIGTDICQISRIYRILSGPRATRFVNRILSPEELARKDARLNVLAHNDKLSAGQVGNAKRSDENEKSHEKMAAGDPELWKCAAFVAGRYTHTHSLAPCPLHQQEGH
ncbi:hypothetical protein ACJ41O_008187 [Fusarium nematophilum]